MSALRIRRSLNVRSLGSVVLTLAVWSILLIDAQQVFAQVDTTFRKDLLEERLLRQFEDLVNDDDENQEELQEELLEAMESQQVDRKLNLNDLPADLAYSYLGMTDYQYYQLQSYISNYGYLVSLYELVAIDGFTYDDLQRWASRIEVRQVKQKTEFFKNLFRRSKSSLLWRYARVLEPKVGYDTTRENHYLGLPFRMAFKYQFSSQDKLQIAFSGEKDAGEQFFRGAQKYGFDFYSGYIYLKNMGLLKKLVVGDYRLNLGQGLVAGSALMSGKGGGIGGVRRFATAIRPVSPLNEGAYYRGVAVEVGNYNYTGTVFVGHRSYDGEVYEEEEEEGAYEGSLAYSGNRRTESEIKKSGQLTGMLFGFDFVYRNRVLKLGVRTTHMQFDHEVLPSDKPYKMYGFSGRGMSNLGVDYQLVVRKVVLFGEAAVSGSGGFAVLQGALFDLAPGASFAVLGRYYDKSYVALAGSSFGKGQGEVGLYLTSKIILTPKIDLNLIYDYAYYPWLRYHIDAPGDAMLASAGIAVAVSRQSRLDIRLHYKKKDKNEETDLYVNGVVPFHSTRLRAIWNYNPYDFIRLKTEVSYALNFSPQISYLKDGVLVYQDVGFDVKKIGLGIDLRLALFDVDTYEERLYAYENDLYYSFTINSHYDQGMRSYIVLSYGYKWFHIWLKCAQTWFFKKKEIGSGLELINGSHKTDVKLQLMVKW